MSSGTPSVDIYSVLNQLLVDGSPGTWTEPVTLDRSGSYSILLEPGLGNSGSLDVSLYEVPDNVGTMVVGTPEAITVAVPGQDPLRTFSADPSQRISLHASNVTIGEPGFGFLSYVQIQILDPSGFILASDPVVTQAWGGFIEPFNPPISGEYGVFVNPDTDHTGNLTLTLYEVPSETGSIIPGTPETVVIGVPGENETRTFGGTSCHVATVQLTNNIAGPFGEDVRIQMISPTGNVIASVDVINSIPNSFGPVGIDESGTYIILVDPFEEKTGSVTLNLTYEDGEQCGGGGPPDPPFNREDP